MKTEIILKITNPHEAARLINLINDGFKILGYQDRNQRGIDGYTQSDLSNWHEVISSATNIECEYADGEIFKNS